MAKHQGCGGSWLEVAEGDEGELYLECARCGATAVTCDECAEPMPGGGTCRRCELAEAAADERERMTEGFGPALRFR